MIGNYIFRQIDNFFLHIKINTANLPYWKLPRPHKSNRFSRLLRYVFEKPFIQKFVGFNLVSAMVVVPLMGQLASNTGYQEIPLNITVPEISQEVAPHVSTQEREFVTPVTSLKAITQGFQSGHPGYDLSSYLGHPVVAFTSGKVYKIESGEFGLGKYIVLDHGHNLYSVYAHLGSFSVKPGDHVITGQKIGEIGMTGYTTGPHLHFEVHDSGVAVNPGIYINQ